MRLQIRELAEVQIGYQVRGRLESSASGTHLLVQMRDIGQSGEIQFAGLARFTPEGDTERYSVQSGHVLFQARGNRNMASLVREMPRETLASNHFYIARLHAESVLPEYLAWFINQPFAQSHLTGKAQGTTMMLISKDAFESLEVDIPRPSIQQTVVRLAELRWQERALVQNLERKRDALIRASSHRAITNR